MWIENYALLCRLSLQRLERLELPLLLEEELARIITSANQLEPESGKAITQHNARSSLIGITQKERNLISESWHQLCALGDPDAPSSGLNRLFKQFYATFVKIDRTARDLFEGTSMEQQSASLMKIMRVFISSLEDPTQIVGHLRKLGIRHMIYGVTTRDFQSFAIALVQTLTEILPDLMTPQLKEAWFTLITSLGSIMTDVYPEVTRGYKKPLWRRTSGTWKCYYCILTHDTISLFKDSQTSKLRDSIFIQFVSDINSAEDASISKQTPYCFVLSIGQVPVYFCTDTAENLEWWLEELKERIAAHLRVARDESGSGSGSEKREAISQIKKLRKKMQRKNKTERT